MVWILSLVGQNCSPTWKFTWSAAVPWVSSVLWHCWYGDKRGIQPPIRCISRGSSGAWRGITAETDVTVLMWSSYWCVTDVDLFGAKPFTVPAHHTPPSVQGGGDVFGMTVFSPLSPISTSDQEMIDMQVLPFAVWHLHTYVMWQWPTGHS